MRSDRNKNWLWGRSYCRSTESIWSLSVSRGARVSIKYLSSCCIIPPSIHYTISWVHWSSSKMIALTRILVSSSDKFFTRITRSACTNRWCSGAKIHSSEFRSSWSTNSISSNLITRCTRKTCPTITYCCGAIYSEWVFTSIKWKTLIKSSYSCSIFTSPSEANFTCATFHLSKRSCCDIFSHCCCGSTCTCTTDSKSFHLNSCSTILTCPSIISYWGKSCWSLTSDNWKTLPTVTVTNTRTPPSCSGFICITSNRRSIGASCTELSANST